MTTKPVAETTAHHATTISDAPSPAGWQLIPLRLKKGKNEVLIGVSEAFGGWGIKGRLLDLDKVKW